MTDRPARVLLVEDNPGDVDLIRDSLEEGLPPVDIAVATDGEQAIAYLQQKAPFQSAGLPDLVLLDLNLPKLGGLEVLAARSRDERLRSIPVVVLTSSDAAQDVARSYALGANSYVIKPVGLQAFQSTVLALKAFWLGTVKPA